MSKLGSPAAKFTHVISVLAVYNIVFRHTATHYIFHRIKFLGSLQQGITNCILGLDLQKDLISQRAKP